MVVFVSPGGLGIHGIPVRRRERAPLGARARGGEDRRGRTMESNGRKRWTASRKAEVVMEGLQGKMPIVELCRTHGVTQSMYYEWKELFIQKGVEGLTYGGKTREEYEKDRRIAQLERKIGSLMLDMDILKKFDGMRARRKARSENFKVVGSV
jgi:transposase-like protein